MQRKLQEEAMDIEKLLEQGNRLRIKPRGYSMYPLIVPGRDEVYVEKVPPQKLRRGDVVLYRRREENTLVLHRIYKKKKDAFFMVGDNQKEIEGPLDGTQIKGKMTGIIRKGHEYSSSNIIYVVVSRLWLLLRPCRPQISRAVHKMRKHL